MEFASFLQNTPNNLLSTRLSRGGTHRTWSEFLISCGWEENYRRIPFCTSSYSISLLLNRRSGCWFDGPLRRCFVGNLCQSFHSTWNWNFGSAIRHSIHCLCPSFCTNCVKFVRGPLNGVHNDIDNNSPFYLPQSLSLYLSLINASTAIYHCILRLRGHRSDDPWIHKCVRKFCANFQREIS